MRNIQILKGHIIRSIWYRRFGVWRLGRYEWFQKCYAN